MKLGILDKLPAPPRLRELLASTPTPRSWIWLAGIAVAAFLGIYVDASAGKTAPAAVTDTIEDASTFIPAGFVLVPIEVGNFEALDSILGKYGVVDLYVPPETPKGRARKVAEQVKILRAPLNPSHFAVLVREADSARLVSYTGTFTVIVQNSQRDGTGIVSPEAAPDQSRRRPKNRRSRITVEVTNDHQGS